MRYEIPHPFLVDMGSGAKRRSKTIRPQCLNIKMHGTLLLMLGNLLKHLYLELDIMYVHNLNKTRIKELTTATPIKLFSCSRQISLNFVHFAAVSKHNL